MAGQRRELQYIFGRSLQIIALLALPSAIWVGQFEHDEARAIFFLVFSLVTFNIGYFLTRFSKKL